MAVAVVVGGLAWLLLVRDGDDSDDGAGEALEARIVDQDGLTDAADDVDHDVFWVGPRAGFVYEISSNAAGNFYVRYLSAGVEAGDPGGYLTVGTYPLPDPVGALRRSGKKAGAEIDKLSSGTLVLTNSSSPTNAYLVYPGSSQQIEVFDPSPGGAAEIARSGAVVPVP